MQAPMTPSQELPTAPAVLHSCADAGPALESDFLLRDHGLLRRALRRFETAPPAQRSQHLRLALDFFMAHSLVEDAAYGLHDHGAIGHLIELQEDTAPHSRLYFSRGMELKRYLEAHMLQEEASLRGVPAAGVDRALLRGYSALRAEMAALAPAPH